MSDSKKIDEGGFAFPTSQIFTPDGRVLSAGQDGMSLRQWYAGMAMANMVEMHHGIGVDPISVARAACQYADALISELKAGAA